MTFQHNIDFKRVQPDKMRTGYMKDVARTVHGRLKTLGAVAYDLVLPEAAYLPLLLEPNETIIGVVFGRYTLELDGQVGRGALVATDRRVMLVDKKPLFVRDLEMNYYVVSGVSYTKVTFAGTLTLFTKFGNIHVRTFNANAARTFAAAVEQKIIANNPNDAFKDSIIDLQNVKNEFRTKQV